MLFYTHVSDQYGPFRSKVISATTGEAPHVLDGLLHHGTTLELKEHYTDTGGANDHVFALCHLLGYRFAPRLRDIRDRRLGMIEAAAAYKVRNPVQSGHRLRSKADTRMVIADSR
jgi:TnpA family transposase